MTDRPRSGKFDASDLIPVLCVCGKRIKRDLETWEVYCPACGRLPDDAGTQAFRRWKASQS